jgi:hypothetical protein
MIIKNDILINKTHSKSNSLWFQSFDKKYHISNPGTITKSKVNKTVNQLFSFFILSII